MGTLVLDWGLFIITVAASLVTGLAAFGISSYCKHSEWEKSVDYRLFHIEGNLGDIKGEIKKLGRVLSTVCRDLGIIYISGIEEGEPDERL